MPHLPAGSLLELLLSNLEEAVVGFLPDGTIILWNAGAEQLYGYAKSDVIGQQASLLLPLDELPAFLQLLADPLRSEALGPEIAMRKNKSGLRVPVHIKRSLLRDSNGAIQGFLERATAVTSLSARLSAEAHLRLLSEQLPVFFWTTDHHLGITSHWGQGFLRRRGALSTAVGRTISDYFRCANSTLTPLKQHVDALLGIPSRFEFKRRSRIFDFTVEPFRGNQNEIIGCLGLAIDITERKKSEQQILYQATHDGLTGLANYRTFFDALEREVLRAERTAGSFALLLVDLNGLKSINDRLGHLTGNRALKRLACAVKESCRASDLAARFGGDEFAVLLIDSDGALAGQVATRMETWLREEPQFPPLSVSIGISVYPQDATSAQNLFEIADQRLYRNKKASHVKSMAAVAGASSDGRLP